MLNPISYLSKFFGSGNQKELKKIRKIVDEVNSLEKTISSLTDEDFPKKTNEFIEKINNQCPFDKIIPEAFALVREASRRVIMKGTLMFS